MNAQVDIDSAPPPASATQRVMHSCIFFECVPRYKNIPPHAAAFYSTIFVTTLSSSLRGFYFWFWKGSRQSQFSFAWKAPLNERAAVDWISNRRVYGVCAYTGKIQPTENNELCTVRLVIQIGIFHSSFVKITANGLKMRYEISDTLCYATIVIKQTHKYIKALIKQEIKQNEGHSWKTKICN